MNASCLTLQATGSGLRAGWSQKGGIGLVINATWLGRGARLASTRRRMFRAFVSLLDGGGSQSTPVTSEPQW